MLEFKTEKYEKDGIMYYRFIVEGLPSNEWFLAHQNCPIGNFKLLEDNGVDEDTYKIISYLHQHGEFKQC